MLLFAYSLLGGSGNDPLTRTNNLNAHAEYDNLRFTVLNFEDRRIGEIKVEILPKEENEDEDSDSKPKDKDKDKGKDKDKD